jgi:hypothetical protein
MRRVLALALAALVLAPAASADVVVRATASPAAISFGDPFTYVVEARGDVSDVRVVADTTPFATVAPSRTERGDGVVRVTQTLACVDLACAPGNEPKRVTLPAARAGSAAAPPVTVSVAPRVPAAAVAAPTPRFRPDSEIAPPTTRVSPGALTAALAVLAAVLVLLAAALLALPLLRRRAPAAGRVDPLARALRLLRESAGRAAPDRRRAADLLARSVGDDGVERDATAVAWSPHEPEPDDALALAGRAEGRP